LVPGAESNHRHRDFQTAALSIEARRRGWDAVIDAAQQIGRHVQLESSEDRFMIGSAENEP
jgi:hypothetical protein